MVDVTQIPTAGLPRQVDPRDMYAVAEPSDRAVWAVCPYLAGKRIGEDKCKGCPPWFEEDGKKWKRGCRALAEEACRTVIAATTVEEETR